MIRKTIARALLILFAAAVLSAPLYALSQSSYVPELTRALNVPRDRSVGLLAGPLNALSLLPDSSPPLPIFRESARENQGLYLEQGVTDIAKNLLTLGFFIALVSVIRTVSHKRNNS